MLRFTLPYDRSRAVPAHSSSIPMALVVVACVLAATMGAPAVGVAQEDVDLSSVSGRGQACTAWFYAREFEKIEALGTTEAMTQALEPLGGFSGFRDTVETQLGAEVEVLEEEEAKQQGLDVYMRTATFEKSGDMQIVVQWVFDGDGAIAGFAVQPKR